MFWDFQVWLDFEGQGSDLLVWVSGPGTLRVLGLAERMTCDRKDTGQEQPCAGADPGSGTGKGVKTVSASVADDFIFVQLIAVHSVINQIPSTLFPALPSSPHPPSAFPFACQSLCPQGPHVTAEADSCPGPLAPGRGRANICQVLELLPAPGPL